EQRHVWARLRTEMTSGWQTEEHQRQRLTVADEREYVMFHLAEVMYGIVPRFYEEIGVALGTLYGTDLSDVRPPVVLSFGSWVGGDMDGIPERSEEHTSELQSRENLVCR